jgi:hypothetical protein
LLPVALGEGLLHYITFLPVTNVRRYLLMSGTVLILLGQVGIGKAAPFLAFR